MANPTPEAAAAGTAELTVGAEWTMAGTGPRIVAYALDLILVVSASALLAMVLEQIGIVGEVPRAAIDEFALSGLSIAIDFAYFVAFWMSTRQATIGMRMVGLRVVREADGGRLGLGPALVRWLLLSGALGIAGAVPIDTAFFSGVALVWFLVLLGTVYRDPRHLGIHDRAAGSLILQRAGASTALGCVLVAVAAIGLVALILLTAPPAIFMG